jgi:hypothetical protein
MHDTKEHLSTPFLGSYPKSHCAFMKVVYAYPPPCNSAAQHDMSYVSSKISLRSEKHCPILTWPWEPLRGAICLPLQRAPYPLREGARQGQRSQTRVMDGQNGSGTREVTNGIDVGYQKMTKLYTNTVQDHSFHQRPYRESSRRSRLS